MQPVEAPPGTVAVPMAPVPADSVPAPGGAVAEQRVVGTELRTRRHDRPGEGTAELSLLEVLPAEVASSVAFPLPYRLARASGHGGVSVRMAESEPARARAYPCQPFYKPISRCVGGAT